MKQFSKELGKVSITPKGDWNSSIANEKLDIVYDRRNNQAYIAKQDVPIGVDIDNREYWQPLNVSGYADNNFINLTTENENGTITAYESLEEAIATIFPINRRVGATLSFYNLNSDRLDRQAEFELWQFNSTDLANWENKDYWNNIYYNWNVFAGWYVGADALKNHVKIPNIGQYAYVGSNLNDAILYQCRTNGTWTNTGIKVRNYISVVVSGNITIGENGNWFSDGEDTGIPATPAVDEQLDNIIMQLQQHTTEINSIKEYNENLQDQITSNDNDITNLTTKHESLSRTVQGIAVTGGASTATNVTYNNDASGLNAENAQDAIDELAKEKADSSDITKKLDKVTIKNEDGTVVDTPFHYIQNEEFIFAKVDAEDKLLFGIQWDGTPKFGKTSKVEDRLQSQVTLLAEKVATIMGDEDTTNVIDTMNELKTFFANIANTQSFTDILANLDNVAKNLDKTTIKDEEDNVQDTPFRVIESPEFLKAITDSEDRFLCGIKPDGSVEWVKGIPSPIRAKLQEIVSQIINLQKTKVDNEEGKSLINEDVADAHRTFEDIEGRMEITTDADEKIMSYRDSIGKKHEHDMEVTNLEVSNLNLKGNSVNDIGDALKANDFKLDSPSDFSKDSYVELPIPRVAAQVRIYASKLPTTKQDDIEAEIEYNDKDGNYFRKPVILNSQGSSSISYIDKETGERGNIAIDINDGSKIKFGDFPTQDSFHLKKYYIDIFRGQCIVGYWLMEQVYQTRPIGKRYPYEMLSEESNPYSGDGKADKDFYTGAKCHPDGFPVIITWIDTKNKKEKNIGIYAWNLKKSKEVYHVNKKTPENIILDGVINDRTLFGGSVDWTQFEIRNPKSLIDIDGNKYDGDNPKELSETDKNSKKVKDYIIRLSGAKAALAGSNNKETFEKYFIVDAFIDYFITSQILYHLDGFSKNWIWGTWNGLRWAPTLYDVDSIWGAHWAGTFIVKGSDIQGILGIGRVLNLDTLYADEIIARYKELRDLNVFSVDNIVNLLKTWLDRIGYDNLEKEISLYPDIPSYRDPQLNEGWEIVDYSSLQSDYSSDKTYTIGDTCVYKNYKFKAIKENINVPPLKMFYEHAPRYCGFYNSIKRVSVWLTNRISFLDKTYKYNI